MKSFSVSLLLKAAFVTVLFFLAGYFTLTEKVDAVWCFSDPRGNCESWGTPPIDCFGSFGSRAACCAAHGCTY